MLVLMTGFFPAGTDLQRPELEARITEELTFEKIKLAGPLRDRKGAEQGYAMLIEVERFDEAETFFRGSVYHMAGLYSETRLLEFCIEAGRGELNG